MIGGLAQDVSDLDSGVGYVVEAIMGIFLEASPE